MEESTRTGGLLATSCRLILLATIVWLIAEGLLGMTAWSNWLPAVWRTMLDAWLVAAPVVAVGFVLARLAKVSRRGRRDLALLSDAALGTAVVVAWVAVLIKGAWFAVWL